MGSLFFRKAFVISESRKLFDDFPTAHSFAVSLRYLSNLSFFQTVKAKRIHQIAVREAFHSALFLEGFYSPAKLDFLSV
jgi:hypothetical protein